MIIVTDAMNRDRFSDLIDEMHRLRARVFEGRLGWEVQVKDGFERDEFDGLDPAHVICLSDEGEVVGCMRLLQTTGPHMLSDVFNSLLDGEPPLRSARIWEATRFCVDTDRLSRGRARNSISYVTSEVMIGAFEYARRAGVLDAVAVIDPVMDRVLRRSGNAPYDYLGSPKPMGRVTALAALMDCSEERIARIRAFSGIEHDIFAPEEQVRATFDAARAATAPALSRLPSDLMRYLADQMADAHNDKELKAALALSAALNAHFAEPATAQIRH